VCPVCAAPQHGDHAAPKRKKSEPAREPQREPRREAHRASHREPPPPKSPQEWNEKGAEHFAAGRYSDALSCFERALEKGPLYVEAWMNKANALFETGQRDEGLQAALRAIEVSPRFARTWLNKGAMENRMGRHALALASFREYMSLGASEPAKQLGEARRAAKQLEADGKKPAPPSAHAFLTQASGLIAEGKFPQALEALDRALALLPGLATALLLKGDTFAEMRQSRSALACYEEGLHNDPTDPRLWHAKGTALSRQGKDDQALACFDEALRLDPGHTAARNGRGWALLQARRSVDALATFDAVLADEGKNGLARFGKACAEDQLGRRPEAARSYRRFLEHAEPSFSAQIEHARARLASLKT